MKKARKNKIIVEDVAHPRMDQRYLKSDRFDYVKYHQLIENCAFDYLLKHMVFPTQKEMAQLTGLSEKTIERHAPDIDLRKMMPQYRHLTPKVMRGLLIKAAKGNAGAAKLWLLVVEGISMKVDHTHKIPESLSKTMTDEEKKKLYELALSEM